MKEYQMIPFILLILSVFLFGAAAIDKQADKQAGVKGTGTSLWVFRGLGALFGILAFLTY